MDGIEALRTEVDSLKRDTAAVKTAVESLKGSLDGFKDSLRTMQWSLGIILALGLAALGWMLSIGNTRVAELNSRLDRFLERQTDTANAANARFDRLLEQRAAQPAAPVVIQLPAAQRPPDTPPAAQQPPHPPG